MTLDEAKEKDATCTFCGRQADAAWSGKGTVYACSHCAVAVLPKLIADAVQLQKRVSDEAITKWAEATQAFWEQMKNRLSNTSQGT